MGGPEQGGFYFSNTTKSGRICDWEDEQLLSKSLFHQRTDLLPIPFSSMAKTLLMGCIKSDKATDLFGGGGGGRGYNFPLQGTRPNYFKGWGVGHRNSNALLK